MTVDKKEAKRIEGVLGWGGGVTDTFRGGGKQREVGGGWEKLQSWEDQEWEGAMSSKLRKETVSRRRGGDAAR